MEPEVRRYFRKIVNSLVFGITWLMLIIGAGLFFDLAGIKNGVHWYNIVFYVVAFVSFIYLLIYFIRVWRGPKKQ